MSLREIWGSGGTTIGAWLAAASPIVAETTARCGFDHVCLDNQHGVFDYMSTVPCIQAVAHGGSTPIVRVPWNEPGIIGKMLDAGAEAIIAPMVNTVEEAEAMVRACRYPPLGERSYGPVLASLRTDDVYHRTANDVVAVIPMIETVTALRNLDDILAVPGIDAVYIGPADLSFSLGLQPQNNDDSPLFTEALEKVVAACRKAGVVPGIHSMGGVAGRRMEQGFRFISVSNDMGAMRTTMVAELAQARSGAKGDGGSTAVY